MPNRIAPAFRTGTNFVRADVIVTDRKDGPVTNVTSRLRRSPGRQGADDRTVPACQGRRQSEAARPSMPITTNAATTGAPSCARVRPAPPSANDCSCCGDLPLPHLHLVTVGLSSQACLTWVVRQNHASAEPAEEAGIGC